MKAIMALLCFGMLSVCGIHAQSLAPQLISSGGGYFNSPDFQIDWSLGEPIVGTVGEDPKLTQGFQQGDLKVGTATVAPGFEELKVFPNPVHNQINIDIGKPLDVELQLYSVHGALILTGKANGPFTSLDVAWLTPGMYLLRITSKGEFVGTFKIQKFNF